MKVFFVSVVALLWYTVAVAQQMEKETIKIVKGSDLAKMMPTITDSRIYDSEGNILDSADVKKKLKTFEYTMGWAKPRGQTEFKRVLSKVNFARQARTDSMTRLMLRPPSPKLWEGVTLDLSPLVNRTDLAKLQGKAVILIFYVNPATKNIYKDVNEVIADYIGFNKFEVFAITQNSYDVAKEMMLRNPILNAHQVIDAPGIVDFYDTGGKPVIVVTNAQHQITYAITEYAAMTPRTLNRLLKAL